MPEPEVRAVAPYREFETIQPITCFHVSLAYQRNLFP